MQNSTGIAILLLLAHTTYAQWFQGTTIRGIVVDSSEHQPLFKASVTLKSTQDLTFSRFQLTDLQGHFDVGNVPIGKYVLKISFVGYHPHVQQFVVANNQPFFRLDTTHLQPKIVSLSEVMVRRPTPVTMRHDTLEFDATTFPTPVNALVEDLLRKLPGIEVGVDGSVQAQGKVIQQVFVNGKPFFGNDPKLATRNLPANLIDKVQIYDKRSEQAIFSGMDDGGRTRTINIVTKSDGNQGLFGQQVAGYGTDGRYQAGGSLNQFNTQRQVSLLSQINNINQPGYGLPAFNSHSGTGVYSLPGQAGGITRSTGAGLNYAERWGKHTEVATSYLVSDATTQMGQTLRRLTQLPNMASSPDSLYVTLISDYQNRNMMRQLKHSANLRLTYQPDSMNVVRWIPDFSVFKTSNESTLMARTMSGKQMVINQSLSRNTSVGNNRSWTNLLQWMHRFHRPGRTLSLSLNTAVNRLKSDGLNQSQNTYYIQPADLDSLQEAQINQRNTQLTNSTTNELTIAYTEPLKTHHTLELRYNGFASQSTTDRTVFDIGSTSNTSEQINTRLSNQYQSQFVTHRIGMGWQVRQSLYSYTINIDLQQANLLSAEQATLNRINRHYFNLLPNVVFQPHLAQNQYLQLQYQTHIAAPSVTQLQPVINVTNPLFIQAGNPSLRPEFTHVVSINYNRYQTTKYRSVFALLTLALTNHRIVSSVTLDAAGVQTVRPVNTNGFMTANSNVSLGRPLRVGSLKSTLNLTTNLNLIRGVSYINTQTNRSLIMIAGQRASINAVVLDGFEIGISSGLTYQTAAYSVQQPASNRSLNTTFSSQFFIPLTRGYRLATDFTYVATAGLSTGYNQHFGLWNGYISRSFFKQLGELRLQVFDLLNQNRSLVRTVTDMYVEDSRSQVLRRYMLLSFIYNLRQFGSNKVL